MTKELGFSRSYDWEILGGLPGDRPVLQFDWTGGKRSHSEGLVVRVMPEGKKPWIGNFQRDEVGLSGAYSYPLLDHICVIAKGQGYLVPVFTPDDYHLIQAVPIVDIHAILEEQIILFTTFVKIVAYGPDGLMWETARLSLDGIEITNVTPETIQGIAWDPSHGGDVEFSVDVQTGHHVGGLDPRLA